MVEIEEADDEEAEAFKLQGNKHFASKNYRQAVECYSEAISLAKCAQHVYYANRSACYIALGQFDEACEDATVCVELKPGYVKGHYRKAQALLEMGKHKEAAMAANAGIKTAPSNVELRTLLTKAKSSGQGTKGGGLGSLYDDKVSQAPKSEAAKILEKIKISAQGGGALDSSPSHELEGVFAQLLVKETFQQTVFPGLSQEQREHAPSTLQGLLADPRYSGAMEAIIPKAMERASKVLGNVKAKAAEVGDHMDEQTEEVLKPQVLQEAFAREVVCAVTAVHAQARAKMTKETAPVASPEAGEADLDQLSEKTVSELIRMDCGFSVQDSYLGEGWEEALRDDISRFEATQRLESDGGNHGEFTWIEKSALGGSYPALEELVYMLQAIPYELNKKTGGGSATAQGSAGSATSMGLRQPVQGTTMLLRMTEGCSIPSRLDAQIGADGAMTGYKVSCVYLIGSNAAAGGGLILRVGDTDREHRIEAKVDRLVLYRSDAVWCEREEVGVNGETWSLLYWMG